MHPKGTNCLLFQAIAAKGLKIKIASYLVKRFRMQQPRLTKDNSDNDTFKIFITRVK